MDRYTFMKVKNTKYKNLGFNYRGNILQNSLSPILTTDENLITFLDHIEGIIQHLIKSVKALKVHKFYTINLDSDFLN
jgi:hypothetical protein